MNGEGRTHGPACLVFPAGEGSQGPVNSVPFPHPPLAPSWAPSPCSRHIHPTSDQTDVLVDGRDSGPTPRGSRPCNPSCTSAPSTSLRIGLRCQIPAPQCLKANQPCGVSSKNEIVEGSGGLWEGLYLKAGETSQSWHTHTPSPTVSRLFCHF